MAVPGAAHGHPARGPLTRRSHRPPGGTPAGGARTRDLGRVLIGLAVIAVGVLYLLEAAGVLDAGEAVEDWWPCLIVGVGAFQLAERSRNPAGPLVLVGLGAFLLLLTTGVVGEASWAFIWPALLVAGGLLILAHWAGAGSLPRDRGEDVVVATGILGGPRVASASQSFEGASLTAVLGGVTLDLRGARPAPAGGAVTATAVLGGIDILVPDGWRVTLNGTPILGGIADRTRPQDDLPEDAPTLRVDALAVLGGVEVKHEPADAE